MDPKEYHTQVLMAVDGVNYSNHRQELMDKWIENNGYAIECFRQDGYSPEECVEKIEREIQQNVR